MQLEIGKTYLSRKGELITIVGHTKYIGFPYRGGDGASYQDSGRFDEMRETEWDLIKEVGGKMRIELTQEELECLYTCVRYVFENEYIHWQETEGDRTDHIYEQSVVAQEVLKRARI